MIKEIIQKRRKRKNTLENQIETLKDELLEDKRKIQRKDEMIIDLFYKRDDLERRINELLEENRELREKKIKKGK